MEQSDPKQQTVVISAMSLFHLRVAAGLWLQSNLVDLNAKDTRQAIREAKEVEYARDYTNQTRRY